MSDIDPEQWFSNSDDVTLPELKEEYRIDSLGRLSWYARKLRGFDRDEEEVKENYKLILEGIHKERQDFLDRFEGQAVEFVSLYVSENNKKGSFVDTLHGRVQVVDKPPTFRQTSKTRIFEWFQKFRPQGIKTVETEFVPEAEIESLKETCTDAQGETVPVYFVPGLEYTPPHMEARIRAVPKRRGMNVEGTDGTE